MKTKLIAAISLITIANAYSEQTISYGLNKVSIGTTYPIGSSWGAIDIAEVGSSSVLMTISANLTNEEFYSSVGLNLVNDFVFGPIVFTPYQTLTTGDFELPRIYAGNNVKTGGGNIGYDLWFEFETANSGGGIKRFNNTDSFTYRIDGIGIDAFKVNSNAVIAHAQNLDKNNSSWIGGNSIPEPSSLLLGCIGMVLLLKKKRYNE